MFCRLGSVLDSRPVAAIVWLNVVWMRPSVCDGLEQALDGLPQPAHVTVAQQRLRNGCSVFS